MDSFLLGKQNSVTKRDTRRWETGSEEHGDVLVCLIRTVNMAAKRWPYFSRIFSVLFLSELG